MFPFSDSPPSPSVKSESPHGDSPDSFSFSFPISSDRPFYRFGMDPWPPKRTIQLAALSFPGDDYENPDEFSDLPSANSSGTANDRIIRRRSSKGKSTTLARVPCSLPSQPATSAARANASASALPMPTPARVASCSVHVSPSSLFSLSVPSDRLLSSYRRLVACTILWASFVMHFPYPRLIPAPLTLLRQRARSWVLPVSAVHPRATLTQSRHGSIKRRPSLAFS